MTAIGALPAPEHVANRIAHPRSAFDLCDVTWEQYCRMPEYDRPRPGAEPLAASTFHEYKKRVERMGREIHGDKTYLFANPPDGVAILRWRDSPAKGGRARLEGDRLALRWLYGYWGISPADLPDFLRNRWRTKTSIREALAAGTLRQHKGRLGITTDIPKMLGARPIEDRVVNSTYWSNTAVRAQKRREGRYLDQTAQTMVFLALYMGPRPAELATLRVDHYARGQGVVYDWMQPKDAEARTVGIPEDWVLESRVDPSLGHYLDHVRPKVDPHNTREEFFLTSEGEPFSPLYVAKFLREWMAEAVGRAIGGEYALRRACATWAYAHGWTIPEIAELLHHDRDQTTQGYVDTQWARAYRASRKAAGRPIPSRRRDDPELPKRGLVRSSGKRHARSSNPTKMRTAAQARPGPESGRAGPGSPLPAWASEQPPQDFAMLLTGADRNENDLGSTEEPPSPFHDFFPPSAQGGDS